MQLRLTSIALATGAVAALVAAAPAAPEPTGSPAFPKAATLVQPRVAAHARPSTTSPVAKVFPQFRSDFRPTVLLAVGQLTDAKGVRWLRISLPMRPNGRKGWVRASAVATQPVRREIVVDLSERSLRVLDRGRVRYRTRVAVGRRGLETPTGSFYLTATFRPKERFLGAFAFETSAYSKLSEWPGGGVVGLHGTSLPWLLGQAVSHGCVRMSNRAALVLKRLTPAGTPLRIVR
jgi:lipoprotein-anchoring transpeptidase ErfK/SrfK